jgi:hypothetical protein
MEHLNTVAITDYAIDEQTPTLAKVMISFTGKFNKESIRAALREQLDNRAAPVEDSFREVKAGVAVGFLRANKELRVLDQKELRASYRAMGSSNIMMSEVDNSLWEVKQGKGGTYLARHGNEDLSELVNANVDRRRTEVPGIRHLSMAKAAAGEFAAFVTKSGDMDYGFVVASNAEKIKVVSHTSQVATVVGYEMVTSISRVPVPKSFVQKMATAGISRADKQQAIEYWNQLYSYNPAYLKDVVDQVNEDTVA